jgi:PAS domain S-box-containing protein
VNRKNCKDDYTVEELLDISFLQRIQDDFAEIADVGSVIYDLEGNPITNPSNFSSYCRMIRSTPKGLENCIHSDAILAEMAMQETGTAAMCKSGRLMDGIAPIFVEGKRIANWGIGQVVFYNDEDEEWVERYALEIGLDKGGLIQAYRELKRMSKDQFLETIKYLITFSRELSEIALTNFHLTKEIQNRKKSEERYRSIVKNAIVGICEITNDGKLEYVNDQLCAFSGFSKEELVGKKMASFLESQRDFKSYFMGISDYANKSYANVGYDFHGYINHKTGEKIPCRVCMTPQINLSNQVVKSSAVIINTSAETKALETLERKNRELYESKKQIDLFFDNNINGLCLYDRNLNRIKYNPAYVQFMQENRKIADFNNSIIWEPFERKTLEKIITGELGEAEVKKEYGVKLYSISATPVFGYNNDMSQLLVTIEDITNYQIMLQNAKFADKMSGAGMLASSIAHDLKGIFSVLGNSNNTLKNCISSLDETKSVLKMKNVLQTQQHGLQNGRKLLAQLLSYSGQSKEKKEKFVLKESVEKIVKIYNSQVLEKNASVSVDIRDSIQIESSSSRFIQIFMNLFSNALDAINTNGCVRIWETCRPGIFSMVFEDDGVGISFKERNKVFEAFFSTKKEGTGLGLFSVKNIIEQMGGTIRVESEYSAGTRFMLSIEDNDMVKTYV